MNADVQQARNSSYAFWLAYERCMEQRPLSDGKTQVILVPAIVCLAFSLETGFKARILSQGGAAPGHDLASLFRKLSQSDQESLVEEVGGNRAAFVKALQAASETFVEWRYIYEHQTARADMDFLSRLAKAAQQLLT